MMRKHEEFMAEIYRRKDDFYKKRRKKIRRITAICAPFALCICICGALMLPAMLSAGSGDMAEPPFSASGYGSNTDATSGSFIATAPLGDITDDFKIEILYRDQLLGVFKGKSGMEEAKAFLSEYEGTPENESIPESSLKPPKKIYTLNVYSGESPKPKYSISESSCSELFEILTEMEVKE